MMNNNFDKIIEKAKTTFSQTTARLKKQIYAYTGTSSASVTQIAKYIHEHPDTRIVRKQFLGLTFSFYELEKDGMYYYLETKNVSYVLQLDVLTSNDRIVTYRSYRDINTLNTQIKFPELKGI